MLKEPAVINGIQDLCEEFRRYNQIDSDLYERYSVKRGLRNADGTGVMAGLTQISNVHGYVLNDGEVEPVEGKLYLRGYSLEDLVTSAQAEERFGFEEIIYLLLFGSLPDKAQLERLKLLLSLFYELPEGFFEDMMLKAPSENIMNKLARSMLAMYSYDEDPDELSLESEIGRALQIIARMGNMAVKAYQVKRRFFDEETMYLHPIRPELSMAEEFLSLLRPDRQYTKEEALMLDLCMMIHAEHGGGNNSTFACRVLSSSHTDAYSAYGGAIGALKGPLHGGANIQTVRMIDRLKEDVPNYRDEGAVADYLKKLLKKEAGDRTGKIYGMGHAVYTLSDPRAVIFKKYAMEMAKNTEFEDDFKLLSTIEALTPELMHKRGIKKAICANVDLYSGCVYKMLGIPEDLFTPLFAVSRIVGWSAHRIEELFTGNRIIRPAYKSVSKPQKYVPIDQR